MPMKTVSDMVFPLFPAMALLKYPVSPDVLAGDGVYTLGAIA
jgi:hypothetical protein